MEQWIWYTNMINIEEVKEFEMTRDFIEYHASFLSPEAIKKIKESRGNEKSHSFQNDKEFGKSLIDRDYSNNEWIERLKVIRSNANFEGDSIK